MRTHIALNVRDVNQSVKFYQKVFGVQPQKQTNHYAKFDLKNPSLNFSLNSSSETLSKINHFGLEVDSPEEIQDWQKHLASQGIIQKPEMQSDCCYARQDKIWFQDPDGNAWEVFYVYEQLPLPEGSKKETRCCL